MHVHRAAQTDVALEAVDARYGTHKGRQRVFGGHRRVDPSVRNDAHT